MVILEFDENQYQMKGPTFRVAAKKNTHTLTAMEKKCSTLPFTRTRANGKDATSAKILLKKGYSRDTG